MIQKFDNKKREAFIEKMLKKRKEPWEGWKAVEDLKNAEKKEDQ